jgi:two-component system cell cycle sensor histidine kinase/response regulator CckA
VTRRDGGYLEPFESPEAAGAAGLLAAIIDSSEDAILSKRLDGTITSWNPGAERLYGYRRHEAVGRHVSLIIPADRELELEQMLRRIANGEHVAHHDTQRLHRDGTVLDVSVTVSPIRDAAGRVTGASAIARDISDRVTLERERGLLDARLHQYERLESLGQLAGGIAHDFNNLLAVIGNYVGFVANELDNQEAALADLEQIQVATARASVLTRQLLSFARRETLQPRVVDVNATIAATEELLRGVVGAGVEVVTEFGPDLWHIEVDPGQFEQVLINLATNARDAMANGGVLTVDTENVEIDETYVQARPGLVPGRYVRLRVSDTGVGMEESIAARAFEPFFTTKPRGDGTGLGLPMVFGIVAQAGGQVQLYSEVGVGTTCRIFLPATEHAAVDAPAELDTALGGSETILVVDDEPAVREAIRRILVASGYTVLACGGGHEALALAQHFEEAIDLLLTDVIMPGMAGREVAERIMQFRPGVPVLYMSGYAAPELTTSVPADVMLLDKPFTESSLLSKVRAALETAPAVTPPAEA